MSTFDSCYSFTEKGLALFRKVFAREASDSSVDLQDCSVVEPVKGTGRLLVLECTSAKDMAKLVIDSLSESETDIQEILGNIGLWCWLAFVFRHQLFLRDSCGQWSAGELHRWYASDPSDWRKGQRHLIRMPVHLLASFGSDADHLLCSRPSVLPEIREQLTSQQDMFDPNFQKLARTLYYDSTQGRLKSGAGGKGPGSPRRLAQVRRQLDMTWDLGELSLDGLVKMLPSEFDRFTS